jgi:7,8-dihydropterin-6-yl-methyl-4-(beta-D-ribofuranosyl)aminobenzene 5'-phosphate synthase
MDRHKILLDTGASDVFIRNAELLGIDLSDVDYVFISHGHSDHAGGLRYFLEHNQKAKAAIKREQNDACIDSAEREQARTEFKVIVSPDAISGKFFSKRGNLHSITTEWPEIDVIDSRAYLNIVCHLRRRDDIDESIV